MKTSEGTSITSESVPQLLELELSRILYSAGLSEQVMECARYSVFPAGKRIRPQLSFALAHDLRSLSPKVVTCAAAIELLHCASLIHDDLPALDNDDLRRGRPSCHKVFGEGLALLTGNILFSCAFEAVSNVSAKAAPIIARAFLDLNRGQAMDLAVKARDPSTTLELFASKTGALFAASCQVGLVAGNFDDEVSSRARDFGRTFGIYFQIVDDIQDESDGASARQILEHGRDDLFRKFSLLVEKTGPLPCVEEMVTMLIGKAK